MSAFGKGAGQSWRHLWGVPQTCRERDCRGDWNRLQINAIGSAWGRDRTGYTSAAGVEPWSATIVAELTR